MALKLGELLIKAGKITTEELDEALTSQIFFGGKLGTHLIEMGCIQEHELTRYLSKITGIAAVTPEQLEAIQPETILLVSAGMAQRYRIIPLGLQNRRLEIAMADPTDLISIDEISFATSFIVVPRLASEPTIAKYLNKYYQIERKERVLRLRGEGRHRPRTIRTPASVEDKSKALGAMESARGDAPVFPPLDDFKGFHIEHNAHEPAPPTSASPPMQSADLDNEQQNLSEAISLRLCEVKDRDDVAALLLKYAGTYFYKAALFIVKKDAVIGWKAVVKQRPVPGFGEITIPLNIDSILCHVVEKKTTFKGELAKETGDVRIWECLGEGAKDAEAIPLLLLNRVVAILYLSGAAGKTDMAELQKMTAKSTMALEILILKNKILMT